MQLLAGYPSQGLMDLIGVEDHLPIKAAEVVTSRDGRQPGPVKAIRPTVPLIATARDSILIDPPHLREEVSHTARTRKSKVSGQELDGFLPMADPPLL